MSTYADFERLDSVVQQEYIAHNLCVLPVSLQFRRPDIVGSASRQAEARAHHALTRVCNKPKERRKPHMRQAEQKKGTRTSFLIVDRDDVRFLGALKAGIHPPRITQ